MVGHEVNCVGERNKEAVIEIYFTKLTNSVWSTVSKVLRLLCPGLIRVYLKKQHS